MFFKDEEKPENNHNIFQKFCYWMRSVLLLSILTGTRDVRAQNLDVSGAEIKEGESATLSCTPRGSGTPESGMIEIHS